MTDQDRDVLDAMRRFGGSFASAIAQAAYRADEDNLRRIREAFPDLWEHYLGLSRRTKDVVSQ